MMNKQNSSEKSKDSIESGSVNTKEYRYRMLS